VANGLKWKNGRMKEKENNARARNEDLGLDLFEVILEDNF
jgi:hypothetical protein